MATNSKLNLVFFECYMTLLCMTGTAIVKIFYSYSNRIFHIARLCRGIFIIIDFSWEYNDSKIISKSLLYFYFIWKNLGNFDWSDIFVSSILFEKYGWIVCRKRLFSATLSEFILPTKLFLPIQSRKTQ